MTLPLPSVWLTVPIADSTMIQRRPHAEVAQSVEHATENRGVGSSILPLGTPSLNQVSIRKRWGGAKLLRNGGITYLR